MHQILSRKLVTLRASDSVQQAAALMLSAGVSCLPVITAGGAIEGIVTLRDLMRLLVDRSRG